MMIKAVRMAKWIGALAGAVVLAVPALAAAAGPGHGDGGHFAGARIGGGAHFTPHAAAPRFSAAPRFGAAPRMGATPRFGAGVRIGGAPRLGAQPRFAAPPRFIAPPRFAAAPPARAPARAAIAPRFGASPRPGSDPPALTTNHRGTVSAWSGHRVGGATPGVAWNGRSSAWSGHGGRDHWRGGDTSGRHDWRGGGDRDDHFHRYYRAWHGSHWGYHPYWRGGWWSGYYWPRAYYGWSFPWFLAALPVGCVTYWWGGIPYYYVNSVYYIWSANDDGYIVTNPPPVANVDVGATVDSGAAASDDSGANAAPSGGPDDIYMYPENGQPAEQQSKDRYECHKWAQDQTGFDPTQPNGEGQSASAADYRRAMIACLDARGYSAQ